MCLSPAVLAFVPVLMPALVLVLSPMLLIVLVLSGGGCAADDAEALTSVASAAINTANAADARVQDIQSSVDHFLRVL